MNEVYCEALSIYQSIFNLLGEQNFWVHYDQTFRAASSIVANIAEGEGSDWGKQGYLLIRLINARGSLCETLAWLDIAVVEGKVSSEDVREIRERLNQLRQVLTEAMSEITENQTEIPNTIASRRAANQEYWAEKAREMKERREPDV